MNQSISRIALAFLLIVGIVLAPAVEAATDQNEKRTTPSIYINGHELLFEQAPFISKGVTFAPGEAFLEMLGYDVVWNEEEQTLSGNKNDTVVVFQETSARMTVNQNIIHFSDNSHIIGDELFIPVRFIAEQDGHTVKWESSIRSIFIESNIMPQVNVTLKLEEGQWDEVRKDLLLKLSAQIEQDHKLKLGFELVPANHYQEKLNVMIASGQKMNLAYMPNPAIYSPNLIPSITWKLNDYIESYEYLSRLPEQSIEQLQFLNNGLYGIPKLASSVDGNFPVLNQQWMDRLGLAQPSSMKELHQVMEHFAQLDPDGNGKKDTYSLTGYINHSDLGSLAWVEHVFNENVSRFQKQAEGIKDLALSNGTREALLWLQKAYREGLIDPEFAVNTWEKAYHSFVTGKSGIAAMTLAQAAKAEADHSGTITPFISLSREHGATAITGTQLAYDGMYFISSFAKREELDIALKVMDLLHGIASHEHSDPEVQTFAVDIVGSPHVNLENAPIGTKKRYEQIEEARAKVQAKELLDASLEAKLDHNLRGEKHKLDQQMLEMKVKVIMGVLPIEEWDNFVSELSNKEEYIAILKAFNH